jgi:hypothetical protein
MSIQTINQEILSLAGTFNVWLVISMFILTAISEFGLSIPFLLEAVWIMTGYRTYAGSILVDQLLVLWLTAVGGRIAGAFVLFHTARLGRSRILKIYQNLFKILPAGKEAGPRCAERIFNKMNFLTPYSVAFGRLAWLKIPLTLTLSTRGQLKTLLPAVALSSLVWDGVHIASGILGGNTGLQPTRLILYSLSALALIYSLVFIIQRLPKFKKLWLDNKKDRFYNY